MAAVGERQDPFTSFNFLVEIEGIVVGGFTECTGLQVEAETFEYREGGLNEYAHRFAGPTKSPPLVLKHGLSDSESLWRWHREITQGVVTRKNGTIYLLDAQRATVMLWHFKEAYPYKWTGPELRAQSAAVAFESVELTHRGLTAEWPSGQSALSFQLSAGLSLDVGVSVSLSAGLELSADFDLDIGF